MPSDERLYRGLGSVVSLVSVPLGMWIASLTPKPSGRRPVAPPALTAEDLIWIQKAQEARTSQLENVRAAAKDWATTITALTGATGIVALIKGPEEIGRLTRGWEIAVGIALLLAMLLALRSILLAALAAQGTPRSFRYSPAGYRTHYRREIGLAAMELRVSRIAVILAMLALIAAIAMTWYGDAAETKGTRAYAVSRDGTVACGAVSVGKRGVLSVKEPDKAQPTRFEPSEVLTLVPVGECP